MDCCNLGVKCMVPFRSRALSCWQCSTDRLNLCTLTASLESSSKQSTIPFSISLSLSLFFSLVKLVSRQSEMMSRLIWHIADILAWRKRVSGVDNVLGYWLSEKWMVFKPYRIADDSAYVSLLVASMAVMERFRRRCWSWLVYEVPCLVTGASLNHVAWST